MTPLSYREYQPSAHLGLFIECFWSIETSAAVITGVPPDGCIDIIFSPDFGLRVVGVMTAEQIFSLRAGTRMIGARFRSGMARTALGAPITDFTDNYVQLGDLWPHQGKVLQARLGESKSASRRIEVLCNAIKPSDGIINPVQRAIRAVCFAHGNLCLDELAAQADLSPRQFRRRCLEESGLTPKHLCRILRFRRAQQLARLSPKVNWARIAAETGYFDQAHLIRDFHEFTGRTPMSVLSNTRSATLP